VLAVFTASEVQIARWDGTEFVSEPPLDAVAAVGELALAVDGARTVVALVTGAGVLRTFRQADDGWEELSGGVDFNAAQQPDVAAAGGVVAVSWQRDDAAELATRHAYAARWDGATWLRFAHAADLDIQTDAVATSIGLDGEQATMAWTEGDRTSRKVYAARAATDDDNWSFLDSALNGDPAADAIEPALVIDGRGNPMVAFNQDGEVVLARWNGSPTLRAGLDERLPVGDCAIPEDPIPADLAGTGCYADVAGHQLVPQLIPFEINSPLWSDGALKRRFLLIPDGESIGYTEAGALTMPVGTLLVKEFWLEGVAGDPKSRFPVETRFLAKRCEEGDCIEPWQGYSYRWNAEGTEAELLDPGSADERTDWTVTDAGGQEVTHTHIYPSRLNCTRCHNAPTGRVLGLQAIQLDRPVDYGGVIADQVATLEAIGVLGGSNSTEDLVRLPSSLDPSYDLESRSRAYYHTNCSHCHRPAGERPTIDFRFQTPLAADNICNQMSPGNGTGSTLYVRDSTRGAGQMPPLATDVADGYQLATTDAWIDNIGTCPH
jgi:mono/diheme cytochrome c family protein